MANPSTMTADIDVDAPVQAVYNQWTQFESFPHFLHAVKEVTQTGDSMTHWVVSIGGVHREFDAEITEQVPDQVVAWASVDGKSHSGSVRFRPSGTGTHVSLEMLWLPETFVEKVGAALNLDERQARMDLDRFKDFIEERGRETGGWRGEIHDGVTEEERSGTGAWPMGSTTTAGASATGSTIDDDASVGSSMEEPSGNEGADYGSRGAGADRDDMPPSPDRV
jgi:uncharacterized protein YndB with AHSA1/START domain